MAHIPHDAYLPFGAGPRECIGDQLGLVSLALALATITARWRLDPLPDHLRSAAAVCVCGGSTKPAARYTHQRHLAQPELMRVAHLV
ncbi:cytochrome P450 [Streptomyces sp. 8N114]|uniref:cytochrome P450 n=1 Tax=Streptomyces sp. 8N114 TaxID=3457419 RepID=UPI003FD3DB64